MEKQLFHKIAFISSVINTHPSRITYGPRSVFSKDERFEQTKKTIESIRKYLPDYKIMHVECSELSNEQTEYLSNNVDIFLNMINFPNSKEYIRNINSPSKPLGEGTMTIFAIQYLFNNNIQFESFIKISGRYWINEHFHEKFYTDPIVGINSRGCHDAVETKLYKLSKDAVILWYKYLINSSEKLFNAYQYEILFKDFLISILDKLNVTFINVGGVSGYIAPGGGYIEE